MNCCVSTNNTDIPNLDILTQETNLRKAWPNEAKDLAQ